MQINMFIYIYIYIPTYNSLLETLYNPFLSITYHDTMKIYHTPEEVFITNILVGTTCVLTTVVQKNYLIWGQFSASCGITVKCKDF